MGLAQMHFSHAILQSHNPGLTAMLFAEIFMKLPPDCKIYSIGEQYGQAMGFLTIESDQFIDTPGGALLPSITPVFKRGSDGRAYLDQVDMSRALKPPSPYSAWVGGCGGGGSTGRAVGASPALEAPYGSIRDCEPEPCQHEWAIYDSGFATRYEYCRKCDCKKEKS